MALLLKLGLLLLSVLATTQSFQKCDYDHPLPHPYDIRKYFVCQNDALQEMMCQKGHIFDSTGLNCNPMSNDNRVQTSGLGFNLKSIIKSVVAKLLKVYKFITNSVFMKSAIRLGVKLLTKMLGNWAGVVNFRRSNSVPEFAVPSMKDAGEEIPLSYRRFVTSKSADCEPPKPVCSGGHSNKLAEDPLNCDAYYSCSWDGKEWTTTQEHCPGGTQFDLAAQTCTNSPNVMCLPWQKPEHC